MREALLSVKKEHLLPGFVLRQKICKKITWFRSHGQSFVKVFFRGFGKARRLFPIFLAHRQVIEDGRQPLHVADQFGHLETLSHQAREIARVLILEEGERFIKSQVGHGIKAKEVHERPHVYLLT